MRSLYKILHTTCHTQWGDLEKRIFNESVWMEKNGHKIIIVAPKDTPLFLKAKEYGFRVYGSEFKRLSIIKDYKFLKQLFYNEKPDIINTHGDRDSKIALYAGKKNSIPLRILSHQNNAHVRNSWFNRVIYKKLCHYIFTTTPDAAKHLQKTFNLKDMQIFSMPGGIVETDPLPEKNEARKRLAQALGLDPETRFIGLAGKGVTGEKSISTFFEVFQTLKSRGLRHHGVIVGEETQDPALQTLAKTMGIDDRIHFTGNETDLWPVYRALDCTIVPSPDIKNALKNAKKDPRPDVTVEADRQTLLESMMCECPVIGPKINGIVDIIDHETTGLLFDTTRPSDLADKILQTLQDEDVTKKRVAAARDHVKKYHTIDAMSRNIIRIYRLHQVKLDRQHL